MQLPSGCKTSTILSFEEFNNVWAMLPEYVRIRNPQIIYNTHIDGFNLQNLYRASVEYKNEYKFSLIIIQTENNQVIGAFLDDVVCVHTRGYLGTNDSFVFVIRPEIKVFYDSQANQKYFYGEMTYFSLGGEG